jgi:uncharacterized protein YtpQ (UPF0354 family)
MKTDKMRDIIMSKANEAKDNYCFTVESTLVVGDKTYKKGIEIDLLNEKEALRRIRDLYLSAKLTYIYIDGNGHS